MQVSKLQLLFGPRKSPLNIETIEFLVNEFENPILLVDLPSYQKLINQFLLFQYSRAFSSEKRGNSGTSYITLEGG